MRNIGLSMTKIIEILYYIIGMSRSMLYRALKNSNLISYTNINDSVLDQIVFKIQAKSAA